MDLREIKKLITLMNENTLSRLEVEEEGKRYLLEKAPPEPRPVMQEVAMAVPPSSIAPPAAAISTQQVEDTVTLNSPMVGTFYRAASPDADLFVNVGDHVNAESVMCIIEAMKVFNEIKAEMSGTVVEILAENSEAVEYNQPLFLIKPD